MSANLNVALTLSLNDRLSAPQQRALANVRREFAGIGSEVQRLSRVTNAANNQMSALVSNIGRAVSGLRNLARAVPSAMAAYHAGKFVLADPIKQTQAYDLRLAHMANTAFSDRDLAGRRAGNAELNASVVGAVRAGGGTREGAAETLDKLIASGAFPISDAMKLLPTLQKAATASNANASDLAQIAITSMQTFGIKRDEIGQAIGMAITAGQLGGFELKDMARWLPQQMAAGRTSGMKGLGDFGRLLASNQAAVLTAGSTDMAGNNLVNLLAKINSQDTSNDAKKLGIDLAGTMAHARSKGMNPLDAFVALVDKEIVGKNAQYQALRKKAAGAGDDGERRATFDAMADIMQGSAIGKIIQDRQALLQLIAEMEGRGKIKEVLEGAGAGSARARGAIDMNFSNIAATPAFKAEQFAQELAVGMQTALDAVNPLLGKMADHLVQSAREHPRFTAAVAASKLALTALTAAVAGAGIARFVTGGGAAGMGAAAAGGFMASRVGAAMVLGAPTLATIVAMGTAGVATAGAGVIGAAGVGYAGGNLINSGINALVEKFAGEGNTLGTLIYDWLHSPPTIKVDVQNGNITAEVQKSLSREGKRN